ncbi:MAG TPA: hypothetical protein QGF58_25085 [Myxococcota bacterium]|nr:hypothetical protein [Myxococcota bacterium]
MDAVLVHRHLRGDALPVESDDIDKAGHGARGAAEFPRALENLVAAWRKLRNAGIRRFVFTADHGFLLLTHPKRLPQGHQNQPRSRYILRDELLRERALQRVALHDLAYTGAGADRVLHMPRGIELFDRGDRDVPFVHGGNSLQERLVPVLTVEHRGAPGGGSDTDYRIQAQRGEGMAELQCITGRVVVGQDLSLGFGGVASFRVLRLC